MQAVHTMYRQGSEHSSANAHRCVQYVSTWLQGQPSIPYVWQSMHVVHVLHALCQSKATWLLGNVSACHCVVVLLYQQLKVHSPKLSLTREKNPSTHQATRLANRPIQNSLFSAGWITRDPCAVAQEQRWCPNYELPPKELLPTLISCLQTKLYLSKCQVTVL